MIKQRYKISTLEDPLTGIKSSCLLTSIAYKDHLGQLTVVFSDKNLLERFTVDPVRLQHHPFLLDTPSYVSPIIIEGVVCFNRRTYDLVVDLFFSSSDNLEYCKKVQYQRWLYNDTIESK